MILTDGNGNPIAEVTADGSGNWTYTPSTPIANGPKARIACAAMNFSSRTAVAVYGPPIPARPSSFVATLDHLEAVGGLLAVFVGDGGGAVIVVGEGDLFGAVGTRDPDLGKVVLYQLSYSRNGVP